MTDVVLDANVFIPKYTRWTLLWVSTTVPAFTPRWSKRILQEAYCNLVLRGLASADEIQAFHRSLVEHFADSWIEQNEIDDLVPTMTNDRKDRHVLAAAALIGSPSVVTSNLADFPTDACERLGVRAARPDDFFAGLVADWSAEIEEALCHYAAVLTNPRPWSLSELLGALARRTGDPSSLPPSAPRLSIRSERRQHRHRHEVAPRSTRSSSSERVRRRQGAGVSRASAFVARHRCKARPAYSSALSCGKIVSKPG